MKVDRLVVDPRRKGCVRVMVDGKVAWSVPADLIPALGLTEGGVVPGEAIRRLEQGADEEGAFRAGLRSLERRNHAERELARKLERKGHPGEAVEAAIARLRRLGLLDDTAFARHYATSRMERGRGPRRLRHDLAALGVAAGVIEEAIAALPAQLDDPLEKPRALAERRARQMKDLPLETRRRRLAAFLTRRGYGGDERRMIMHDVLRVGGGD